MMQICRWLDPLMVDASWLKRDTKTRDISLVIFTAIQDSPLFEEEKKPQVFSKASYNECFFVIGRHAD